MRWRREREPIDVLVVCTGNICRSPMALVLLRAACPGLRVESAGTHAGRGQAWHPLAIEALAEAGHLASGTARRLRAADVKAASLILTAEGRHRAEVIRLDPTAEHRTYTLLEAARLLDGAAAPGGIDELRAVLEHALAAQRTEHDDDLADPLGGDLAAFRLCLRRIGDALAAFAPALAPRA